MRIISGEYRSRRLFTPAPDMDTRPIPDRVKESVFNILRGHTDDATVADLFAGTGAIGLEALSRGAARCVFVERDRDAAKMLRLNVETLGCTDRAEIIIGDALGPGALARLPRPLKLAFFDPPYPLVRDPVGFERTKAQLREVIQLLAPDGYAVLRLPFPFVHEFNADGSPAAPAPRTAPRSPRPGSRGKGRHKGGDEPFDWRKGELRPPRAPKGRKHPEPEIPELDPDDPEALPELDAEPLPPRPDVKCVAPSLAIDGALGPETHEYGTMAVHLYMRKP